MDAFGGGHVDVGIILSGVTAVGTALALRSLPMHHQSKAIAVGFAVLLRVLPTLEGVRLTQRPVLPVARGGRLL